LHWVGIGVVAIFLVLLPLTAAGNLLLAKMLRAADVGATPAVVPLRFAIAIPAVNLLCVAISMLAGGYLVGRFGGRARTKEATLSGSAAALIAWLMALTAPGEPGGGALVWALRLVVLLGVGSSVAFVGGLWGVRGRR
jgi:hypothetical protein